MSTQMLNFGLNVMSHKFVPCLHTRLIELYEIWEECTLSVDAKVRQDVYRPFKLVAFRFFDQRKTMLGMRW